MNSLRAIIVDDEPLAHDVILSYAEAISDLIIVGQCYKASEAIRLLDTLQPDILFLDIQMPDISGITMLRSLEKRPEVIITSAFEEYALDGFELSATDYLLKPFRFDRFVKAIEKARMHKQNEPDVGHYFFVKSDKKQIRIDLQKVQFIESYGNYVKIWLDDNFILTSGTLSEYEKELTKAFLRIHKSYLIRPEFIESVEGNMIRMLNKQIVAIGRKYRQEVLNKLGLN